MLNIWIKLKYCINIDWSKEVRCNDIVVILNAVDDCDSCTTAPVCVSCPADWYVQLSNEMYSLTRTYSCTCRQYQQINGRTVRRIFRYHGIYLGPL